MTKTDVILLIATLMNFAMSFFSHMKEKPEVASNYNIAGWICLTASLIIDAIMKGK